jgi:hypothetical protein
MAHVDEAAHPRLLVIPRTCRLAGHAGSERHTDLVRPVTKGVLRRDVGIAPDGVGRRSAGRRRAGHVAVGRLTGSKCRDDTVKVSRPGGQARLLKAGGAARRNAPDLRPAGGGAQALLDQVAGGTAGAGPSEIDLGRRDCTGY